MGPAPCSDGLPRRDALEGVLADPSASLPLRRVIVDWLSRDPVDAANDAEALARLFCERAAGLIERPGR